MTYEIISKRLRKTIKVRKPDDVYQVIRRYANYRQEVFLTITLSCSHEIIGIHIATIGLINRTIIHPREVYIHAILDNAFSIVIAHNHPSGTLKPSNDDEEITKHLKQAGDVLRINVLDHLIISKKGYYSFRVDKKFLFESY
jgi:DNA repair protein RadC